MSDRPYRVVAMRNVNGFMDEEIANGEMLVTRNECAEVMNDFIYVQSQNTEQKATLSQQAKRIEELTELVDRYSRQGIGEMQYTIAQLKSIIEEQEEAQRWIPVSEVAPQNNEKDGRTCTESDLVWLYDKFERHVVGYLCYSWGTPLGYINNFNGEPLSSVTHWKPLDAPPQAKQEEER